MYLKIIIVYWEFGGMIINPVITLNHGIGEIMGM